MTGWIEKDALSFAGADKQDLDWLDRVMPDLLHLDIVGKTEWPVVNALITKLSAEHECLARVVPGALRLIGNIVAKQRQLGGQT